MDSPEVSLSDWSNINRFASSIEAQKPGDGTRGCSLDHLPFCASQQTYSPKRGHARNSQYSYHPCLPERCPVCACCAGRFHQPIWPHPLHLLWPWTTFRPHGLRRQKICSLKQSTEAARSAMAHQGAAALVVLPKWGIRVVDIRPDPPILANWTWKKLYYNCLQHCKNCQTSRFDCLSFGMSHPSILHAVQYMNHTCLDWLSIVSSSLGQSRK